MRISHVSVDLTREDINSIIADQAPESKVQILDIAMEGIRGQIKLFLWNIDFVARPSSASESEVSIDVSAHKLVPIPGAIVNMQLKEAVKDAPPGVDVIRQALKVHLPSLLSTFGVSLAMKELKCYDGYLRIVVDRVELPNLQALMSGKGKR